MQRIIGPLRAGQWFLESSKPSELRALLANLDTKALMKAAEVHEAEAETKQEIRSVVRCSDSRQREIMPKRR